MRSTKYVEWFVRLNKDNTGVTIFTDTKFELTLKDVYFNSITNLSVIEFVFRSKVVTSKSFCDDMENVTITKINTYSL